MFPYRKILRQTLGIVKNHKFLYGFGLLLILSNIFSLTTGQTAPKSDLIMLASALISVALLVISLRANAGIIIAVKAIKDKEETSFGRAWNVSRLFYFRLFLVTVTIFIVLLVLGAILSSPVLYLYQQGHTNQAWVLGSLAAAIFLAVVVPLWLIGSLAPMFIVIYDQKFREVWDKSFALIKQFLPQLVSFGLVLLLLELIPVVILSILTYYIHGLIVKNIGMGIVALAEIFVLTYTQTAWVLVFLELIRPQKFEEEEGTVPIPEII